METSTRSHLSVNLYFLVSMCRTVAAGISTSENCMGKFRFHSEHIYVPLFASGAGYLNYVVSEGKE